MYKLIVIVINVAFELEMLIGKNTRQIRNIH